MPNVTLHHDRHFDFVPDEDGEFTLATADGPKQYRRESVDAEGNTTELRFPDDYDANPQALMHLIQTVTERNAAQDDIVAVSGDDAHLVAKLATLLDAEVREESQ